jgi:hypothetical protein
MIGSGRMLRKRRAKASLAMQTRRIQENKPTVKFIAEDKARANSSGADAVLRATSRAIATSEYEIRPSPVRGKLAWLSRCPSWKASLARPLTLEKKTGDLND